MIHINDIGYGNPPLEYLKSWEDKGLRKFGAAMKAGVIDRFIMDYPHPPNDSLHTQSELLYLESLTDNLTGEQMKLCKDMDEGHYHFYSLFCSTLGLEVSSEELEKMVEEYWGIISYIKFRLNRPRPYQLGWYYKLRLFPNVTSQSANSASYPSGHVFEFLLITDYLSKKFPQHSGTFNDLYLRIKNVRELSGVHYPSDTEGSEILFSMLKQANIID